MGNVLKGNRYRLISNNSFELPLPLKYELFREDSPVAEYEISNDEKVSCRILTKFKEEMLTPVRRPLGISDMYYFLSSRVFQDNTPFTYSELALLGLEKYNVYDILRKTRGITPYDKYWLKFSGDNCSGYEEALGNFNELMSPKYAAVSPAENIGTGKTSEPEAANGKPAEIAEPVFVSTPEPQEIMDSAGGKMSQNDIENLLGMAASEFAAAPDPEPTAPSGGSMSQDDIEKMLAAATAPDPEPTTTSGGSMSQDDIEKMLAAATAPDPEPATASGGSMSQDDIEKMLAAAEPVSEPAPVTVSESASGGKMSQDDIEKMLAAVEPVSEPAPVTVSESASGGKMSQDDIEKMLAAAAAAEPDPEPDSEPAPAPVSESSSGGKMSQADIEALLNGMAADAKK